MKKVLLIITVIVIFGILKIYGVSEYLTLENLKLYRSIIEDFVKNNFFMASFVYIFMYIFITAFSIPGASVMSLAGGYFFGIFPGFF